MKKGELWYESGVMNQFSIIYQKPLKRLLKYDEAAAVCFFTIFITKGTNKKQA
ncbi:hypothetical protein E3422_002267 [Enterococcus faecium]|nr:hypothetical protein [Enterococcus faecium]